MAKRKIIEIDEEKCNGCGVCVPNCVEGAIQIIDGKARLVKDSYCDGLGACLGHCPQDALKVIGRDADEFDEEEALKFAQSKKAADKPGGEAHHHPGGGCPGSRVMTLKDRKADAGKGPGASAGDVEIKIKPQLSQWPVQFNLVPVKAPFFEGADLLVTADCVPYAYADFHLGLLKGKALVVGCPKLDDVEHYTNKLTEILKQNDIKSVTVAHMEVPCCSGIVRVVDTAVRQSGRDIPVEKVRVTIDGQAETR